MKEYQIILDQLSKNAFPKSINEENPLLQSFKELLERGYVTAINDSSLDGDSYLEPRISVSGKKFLRELT